MVIDIENVMCESVGVCFGLNEKLSKKSPKVRALLQTQKVKLTEKNKKQKLEW